MLKIARSQGTAACFRVRSSAIARGSSIRGERVKGTADEILLTTKENVKDHFTVPSLLLKNVVRELEIIFKASETILYMNNVRAKLLEKMDKGGNEFVCPSEKCKVRCYVLHLYISIRLNFALEENNRRFASESGRAIRKLFKLQHR